jgi:nitrite reductase/ring-hydroxylating ferredoxin subunit
VVPLPKPIEHKNILYLKHVGGRCSYCNGTTGLDSLEGVVFCYSCDACFDLTTGKFLGVKAGIGLR